MKRFGRTLPLFLLCLVSVNPLRAYSVLSHEAVVDALWDVGLRPFLLSRYPAATPDDLKRAHGYAYGGAIIQDLGYYPHGSTEFSDLTHYVRTGDFILALIHQAHNLNELAFALGALSHYVGDLDGHCYATNVGEAILYPKLKKKFGAIITYEESPSGHLKTEFGFDVLEVARGNFAPQAYHDFIGFFVAKDLVARGFRDTYGLELSDLFSNFGLAIESYRSTVSRIIPLATRIAWAQNRGEIYRVQPGMTHRRFVYILKRSSYEREWGRRLQEPNRIEKFLAWLLKLLPPIGPLQALRLKIPTPQVEQLFMASYNRVVTEYGEQLRAEERNTLDLPDKNYDIGDFTPAGTYRMNDDTQAFWLHKLAEKNFATISPDAKKELLDFYKDLNASIHTKQKPDEWKQTLRELEILKNSRTGSD
jgi:Zinc dependent phospholipase C